MTATAPIKSTGILEFEEWELMHSNLPSHAVLWVKLIDAGFPLNPTLWDWWETPAESRQGELIRAALTKCGAKEIRRTSHPSGKLTFEWC